MDKLSSIDFCSSFLLKLYNIIKEAKITGYPENLSDYSMPRVIVTFENDEEKLKLFGASIMKQ